MTTDELLKGIANGDRTSLSRAITLVESHRSEDWEQAKELLGKLPKPKQASRRIGFSGPPGVGKSTLIEKLGLELLKTGDKVAVLAIDPSSEKTGGSILGDKTRMEQLSRAEGAFVRPSPNRGHLGGVTATLPAVILLCEAAGYSWIMIESVGVGQSEVELARLVDFFTLLALPGAGDELQGIKKGILEYADMIAVNKADRDPALVNQTQQQYLAALKILRGESINVKTCSALTGQGVDDLAQFFVDFFQNYKGERRAQFRSLWFDSLLLAEFKRRLDTKKEWRHLLDQQRSNVVNEQTSVMSAIDDFFTGLSSKS